MKKKPASDGLGVPCPVCASPIGKRCVDLTDRHQTPRATPHQARLDLAKRRA